jgi:hypothetical protein
VKTGRRSVLATGTAPAPPASVQTSKKPATDVGSATPVEGAAASKSTSVPAHGERPLQGDVRARDAGRGVAKTAASQPGTSAAASTAESTARGTSTATPASETDPSSGAATGTTDPAGDPVDHTAKYAGRQVEKFINVPTTLVGLLLSKRPKAKSTTINQIQVMTHTIISKMLPTGLDGAGADATSGTGTEAVEGEGGDQEDNTGKEAAEVALAGDDVAPVNEKEADNDAADEEVDEGESSEDEKDGDSEDGGEEGAEEAKQGEDEKEGEGEGSGDNADVGGSVVATDGGTEAATEGLAAPGAERVVDEAKRRAIAESERLGYVVFRVLGYHEENVDTVIQALQDIIGGERIAQVCERLRVTAQKLQWPPNKPPPKWLRQAQGGDVREAKLRKDRPLKTRDTLRPKSSRLRRSDDQGDGGDAEGEPEGTEGVPGVSSRYRGKNPRPREQLQGDGAEAVAGGPVVGKRPVRGPPREPREPRARPPRESAAGGSDAAGGEA